MNSNEVHKNKSDENPNEVHESEPGTKHEFREDDSEKMDEVHEIDFQAGKNTGGKSEVNIQNSFNVKGFSKLFIYYLF